MMNENVSNQYPDLAQPSATQFFEYLFVFFILQGRLLVTKRLLGSVHGSRTGDCRGRYPGSLFSSTPPS